MGRKIFVSLLKEVKGDLIISNNDFSDRYDLPAHRLFNPPVEMGWRIRKKHRFFKEYNELAREFSSLLKIDPWHLTVETQLFAPFQIDSQKKFISIKSQVRQIVGKIKTSSV